MMSIFIISIAIWGVIWAVGALYFLGCFLRGYWRFRRAEKRLGRKHHG